MILFDVLVDKYKEHLFVLNRAERTIDNHIESLEKFIKFIEKYKLNDIQEVSKDHIDEFQRYLYYYRNRRNQNDSVRVQNRHLWTIKSFFEFLVKEGYISNNPAQHVQLAKEPRLLPKAALTDEEVRKILDVVDINTAMGYRDRTILELLYSTGIRRSELVNLKIADVDYREGELRVNQGKGRKDRVVPVGKIACRYVENYIKGIRGIYPNAKNLDWLFITSRGCQMHRHTLCCIVKRYAKEAGIKKHVTTHTFRRSCATEMIKNRANIMHLRDLLGHSSMDAIQAYCNLSIADLKEAHRKHHPREL